MRQLYSVRKERFGITFNPANKASPSSRTALMMCKCRCVPNSFNPSKLRNACAAGSIGVPGRLHWSTTWSKPNSTNAGRNKNNPPNLVRKVWGSRFNLRASATSPVTGRIRAVRSSSPRRGNFTNPSCLRIAATATGVREISSFSKATLIS